MRMNEYGESAVNFAFYPTPVIYPALGLAGEAGEVAEKIKKIIRDGSETPDLRNLPPEETREIVKELGDVLWYIANLGYDLGYTLEEIAEMNLRKLSDRADRKVLSGSGDNR
jgi:NTP pyrophosphatase (non-canonical NTP hydrolase)